MGDDVCAQVFAPCGKDAIENSEDAYHDYIGPSLVAVEQAEHQSLTENGYHYNWLDETLS